MILSGYLLHSHGIDGPFIDGLPIKNGDFPWQTVSHNQMFIILQTSWGWIKDDQRPMIHTSPLTGWTSKKSSINPANDELIFFRGVGIPPTSYSNGWFGATHRGVWAGTTAAAAAFPNPGHGPPQCGRSWIPSGKHTKNCGKSPCFMCNSTISMAIFNSKLLVYQRVLPTDFDWGNFADTMLWIFMVMWSKYSLPHASHFFLKTIYKTYWIVNICEYYEIIWNQMSCCFSESEVLPCTGHPWTAGTSPWLVRWLSHWSFHLSSGNTKKIMQNHHF